MTSEHTPGPWTLSKHSAYGDLDLCTEGIDGTPGKGGWFLSLSHGLSVNDPSNLMDEFKANARLIAAAPDTAVERDKFRENINDLTTIQNNLMDDRWKLTAERDSLKAINAELLAALEDADRRLRGAGMIGGLTNDPVVAAIAKAKETTT